MELSIRAVSIYDHPLSQETATFIIAVDPLDWPSNPALRCVLVTFHTSEIKRNATLCLLDWPLELYSCPSLLAPVRDLTEIVKEEKEEIDEEVKGEEKMEREAEGVCVISMYPYLEPVNPKISIINFS